MILSTMSAKNVTCCCYIGNKNLYYEFMGNSYSTKPISYYWNEIRKDIQDLYYFYVYGFDLNNNWIFSHRLDGFVVADVINLQDIKHSKFRPF